MGVCPEEMERDNGSPYSPLVDLQIIKARQTDKFLPVNDLVLMQVLKEGCPDGSTEKGVAVVVAKVGVPFLQLFQGHGASLGSRGRPFSPILKGPRILFRVLNEGDEPLRDAKRPRQILPG